MEADAAARRPDTPASNRLLWAALGLVVLLGGLLHARILGWVCDDAFISFQYARNLIAGHGLVYNVGERVEGYTNFLWTLMLAGVMRLGADPVVASKVLGLLSFAALLLMALAFSRRLSREPGVAGLYLPLCALALAAHRDMSTFATGGLETSLFTSLLFGGFLLLAGAQTPGRYAAAGLVLSLAAMARPDGVLVIALSGLLLLVTRRWKELLVFSVPVALLCGTWWVWRLVYYRQFFPNTFYAKSASESRWDQGWLYVRLYLGSYRIGVVVALVLLLALAGLWLRRRGQDADRSFLPGSFSRRALALSLLYVIGYSFYVVRVGGDFMFGRFMVPVTPFIYAAAECLLAACGIAWLRTVGAVLLVTLTLFRAQPIQGRSMISGIANERGFYPPSRIKQAQRRGAVLREHFRDLPVRMVFFGTEAMLVYYAEPAVAIEGVVGLTDAYIAQLPAREGGRIGHDKRLPYDYLIRRHINFAFAPKRAPKLGRPMRNYQVIQFTGPQARRPVKARIVSYERGLMDELKRRGAEFWDFPSLLDDYIQSFPERDRETIRRDYAEYTDYYFAHNDDPERRRAFERALEGP